MAGYLRLIQRRIISDDRLCDYLMAAVSVGFVVASILTRQWTMPVLICVGVAGYMARSKTGIGKAMLPEVLLALLLAGWLGHYLTVLYAVTFCAACLGLRWAVSSGPNGLERGGAERFDSADRDKPAIVLIEAARREPGALHRVR